MVAWSMRYAHDVTNYENVNDLVGLLLLVVFLVSLPFLVSHLVSLVFVGSVVEQALLCFLSDTSVKGNP